MKRTTKYQLGYFEESDTISSVVEMQRWETLDAQLYGLFEVLGNGVIEGWDLLYSSGLSITVTPGSGHVSFVAVKSTENSDVPTLSASTRNYIYAALTADSYWNQTVVFACYAFLNSNPSQLYLGYVDTDETSVTNINVDDRVYLGFINIIKQMVKDHKHVGGDENPPPVDLGSEVQGIINQNSLPDIDASKIKTGTLDLARLPLIDHITKLINQGTLTHSQLDSFVSALFITGSTLMGETSTIDLLRLILALKHIYPDIDQYLVNEIAYIPGISPDNYVDWDNTTAIVDTKPYSEGGLHTITGAPTSGKKAYTYVWDTTSEFQSGTNSNVLIDGNMVTLDTEENTLLIDKFSDLSKWQVITDDLSSLVIALASDTSTYVEPPNSAKLVVGDQTVEIELVIKKTFDAQDWSEYNKIIFYLKTTNVQHGDIYFYLNDSSAGTQNSHTRVLNRNVPTVNIDTLENGWQEITVDISAYTRNNIDTIGFYVSSQDGWDTSKGFDLNIDKVYLTTGYIYKENGYLRVIFGSDFLYDFWRLRWDVQIPTDAKSAGIVFKARTRVGNSLADLAQSGWSSYTLVSGDEISLPAPNLYKYIEIETYFGASTDLSRTPSLTKILLDYYATDVDNSFDYNTKDDWDSGSKYNIDTSAVPNSMVIYGTDEINDIIYGSDGLISWRNESLSELYRITSTMLPRSTYQILNGLPSSMGLITGVSRGNNGSLWFSDTDNDRVIEVDKSGGLIRGFFGSYLVENTESSQSSLLVSGATSATTTTTTTAVSSTAVNPTILQALYNSNKGILYVIFNRELTTTEMDNFSGKTLRIGTNIFYLDQFTASHPFAVFLHVMKIELAGADKTLLNYTVNNLAPSILILSPYQQQRVSPAGGIVTVKFIVNNFTLGTQPGENGIRVTLDGTTINDIYTTSISYTNLSSGNHTIVAQLLNADGTLNTNIEAVARGSFVVSIGSYTQPYISITSPKPNQIYSSQPAKIEFSVENFAVLTTGQHLRYQLDTEAPVDYYSRDPIIINDIDVGTHVLKIYMVDKKGTKLNYTYGSATVYFIVGLNSKAIVKFYCLLNGSVLKSYVDVANLLFSDVYAPFDVQYIAPGNDPSNPDDKESVLIGKLANDYIVNQIGAE